MKKFNKKFKVGTKVKLTIDRNNLYVIKDINEERNLIQVIGLLGSFQLGHVLQFSNK